jgi:DNA repair protein RadC
MKMKELKSVIKVKLRQVRDGRVKFKVDKITRPAEVFEAVRPFYRQADREMLSVLCLDAQNQPTCFNICAVGSLNTTRTRPADILKVALLSNSLSLVLIHNHPSQSLEASPEDVSFTRSVRQACETMGLELYDHVILTDNGFSSLREQGLL